MKQINTVKKLLTPMRINWRIATMPLLALIFFLLLLYNLSAHPMWWDEGWTLSVARTWVERGHYGRLLNGQLAPPGLEAAFPVTALVALSFKLLGVGIWQGRLFGVVCTVGALLLMYHLAYHLYNRAIAGGTLFVLLLMPMHPLLHPIIMGQQALAEMPMLLYLLAGYACFLATLRCSIWVLPLASLCWGIALITKAQLVPFWTVAMLVSAGVALFKRQWRMAGIWSIALCGAFITTKLLLLAQGMLLQDQALPGTPIHGLYNVTALVLIPGRRVAALVVGCTLGLPTLLGLGYGVWEAWRWLGWDVTTAKSVELVGVRFSLLALAGSWLAWYVFFSVNWVRYLFPPIFLGSFFLAALLYDLTAHLRMTLCSGGIATRQQNRQTWWQQSGEVLAILLVFVTSALTIPYLYAAYRQNDLSAQQVVDFVHTHTAADALIETYDSELHFLLDRRYHYPPDQVHVELNRRTFLQQDVPIDYDPLAANPDYLVVGPFARMWQIYDPVIADGSFRLLHTIGQYEMYERAR